MTGTIEARATRRALLAGIGASGVLALPACSTLGGFSLVDAVRRVLLLSSERAFARMLAPGGYWDDAIAGIGLGTFLGTRGDILSGILTSALFRDRLTDAFGDIAFEAADRAAPIVTEAIRTVGIANAVALIEGGPTAATAFLRGNMGETLVEAMVPEVGTAMRIANEPLVGELLNSLTGVDVAGVAQTVSGNIDDAIWREMGVEETAIRADPLSTNDPVIIGVLGAGRAL